MANLSQAERYQMLKALGDVRLTDAICNLIDNKTSNPALQNLDMGEFKVTNLGTPTEDTDATTKAYVDSVTPDAPVWGNITGTLSNQTDLAAALAQAGSDIVSSPLSGSYPRSVVVTGDAVLSSDTVINGNLFIDGDFTNTGGFGLTVHGDLTVTGAFIFTPALPDTSQDNVTITGNFYYRSTSEFTVNPGMSPGLEIHGDMVGTNAENDLAIFNGSGNIPGASGLSITVLGNAIGVYPQLSGAAADATNHGQAGGNMFVGGFFLGSFTANGGNSDISGKNAGNGGSLTIWGPEYLEFGYGISMNGGTVSVGSGTAGNGGSLEVYNFSGIADNYTSLNGGDADSGTAGEGGRLRLYEAFNSGTLFVKGGNSSSGPGGNGGLVVSPYGTTPRMSFSGGAAIDLRGGDGGTTGGNGGTISPETSGDINAFDLILSGGNGGTGNGGNAGSLSCFGTLSISGAITMEGGNSGSATGGSGGDLNVSILNVPSGGLSQVGKDGGVDGNLTILSLPRLSAISVANAASASVSVGTLTNKIEVFDKAGNSLGFVPVYDSIT